MATFPKSKIVPPPPCFCKHDDFVHSFYYILHQLTKFDENLPIHGVEISVWWNSRWRPPPSWINKIESKPSILGKGRLWLFFFKNQDGGRLSFWNCNDVIWDYLRWVFVNIVSVLRLLCAYRMTKYLGKILLFGENTAKYLRGWHFWPHPVYTILIILVIDGYCFNTVFDLAFTSVFNYFNTRHKACEFLGSVYRVQ